MGKPVEFLKVPVKLAFDPRLSPIARALAVALLWESQNTALCAPTNVKLGKLVGKTRHSISRALGELEDCGFIKREQWPAGDTLEKGGRVIRLLWIAEPKRAGEVS